MLRYFIGNVGYNSRLQFDCLLYDNCLEISRQYLYIKGVTDSDTIKETSLDLFHDITTRLNYFGEATIYKNMQFVELKIERGTI